MKLQIALDGNLQQSLSLLQVIHPYIDIVEIGTPLIFREGMQAVRRVRALVPDLAILADLKIMDAGRPEAEIAFEAGSDLVTVLGVTQDSTVRGAVEAAAAAGKQVVADLMQVTDSVGRSRELLALGCDYLCVHTAYDLQRPGVSPLDNLRRLRDALPDAPLAVAGGISPDTITPILAYHPAIVVVGGALANSPDPVQTARALRERMNSQ